MLHGCALCITLHTMTEKFAVGVDLGGTKIDVGIIRHDGKVIKKKREQTLVQKGPHAVIQQMLRMTNEILQYCSLTGNNILGIGIGAAGPMDMKKGFLIQPPNLPGWERVQIVKPFAEKFKTKVILNNDANAAALAEWYFGAGKRCKNMVYLTVSTGIGGGIIINGKLYLGANDNAGELGHQTILPDGPECGCGNNGCLEALASGTSIARIGREAVRKNPQSLLYHMANYMQDNITAKMVFQAAAQGDSTAQQVVEKCAAYLGIGIANIINAFNPQRVVLGGGVSRAGKTWLSLVREEAKRRAMKPLYEAVDIVLSELGDDVGVIGAATLIHTGGKYHA